MPPIPERLTAALADRYRIERELGEGGMATVYLADDLKHNRKVALKVLKPELAAVVGAERFLAEIETTAQLQHPHILPLFDSGEADSFLYYVMPFVEGETLRDRLNRERQLPVADAVALAGKVASALAYAHEKNVLHRDIKPANILLSRGEPLVADFGIALALGAAGGGRLTETGLSVGTPYYMSPEQATGDQYVGPPSDIYGLGCILYEMLVGEPPHSGGTAQAVLGKIISGAPVSPTSERPSIPANVDATIRRALERIPADRFGEAQEMVRALNDPSFRHGEDLATAPSAGGGAGFWKPLAIVTTLVAVGSLAIGALTGGGGGSGDAGHRDMGLPWNAPLLAGRSTVAFDVASDGSFMVYEASRDRGAELWYRSLVDDEVRPIRGTEGTLGRPAISPDGSRVAFASGGDLKVVDLASETVTIVGEADLPTGTQWRDDGLIIFAENDGRGLQFVDPDVGLVREAPISYCLNAFVMVDDTRVLCGGGSWKFAFSRELDDVEVIQPWARGQGTGVEGTSIRGAQFSVVDDDYLVYLSMDGSLMAAPIMDLDDRTVGRSVTLVSNIRREPYSGFGQFDIAANGTLVYGSGLNAEVGRLVQRSRAGLVTPLNADEAIHLRYRESPDGTRLATVVETVRNQELRVYDLATGNYDVVAEDFWISAPVWSPDGQSLVYEVNGQTLSAQRLILQELNSSAAPRVLRSITGVPASSQPGSWTADDLLIMGASSAGGQVMLIDPTQDPITEEALPFEAYFIALSPDGRWLVRQNPGELGIYVQPFPSLDRQYTVSQTGAEPQWLSNGDLIYYDAFESGDGAGAFAFYRVDIDPSRTQPVGEPELMFDDPRFADTPGWSFAPTRDEAVTYLQSPSENTVHYLRVIPNWVNVMKAAVAEANR